MRVNSRSLTTPVVMGSKRFTNDPAARGGPHRPTRLHGAAARFFPAAAFGVFSAWLHSSRKSAKTSSVNGLSPDCSKAIHCLRFSIAGCSLSPPPCQSTKTLKSSMAPL